MQTNKEASGQAKDCRDMEEARFPWSNAKGEDSRKAMLWIGTEKPKRPLAITLSLKTKPSQDKPLVGTKDSICAKLLMESEEAMWDISNTDEVDARRLQDRRDGNKPKKLCSMTDKLKMLPHELMPITNTAEPTQARLCGDEKLSKLVAKQTNTPKPAREWLLRGVKEPKIAKSRTSRTNSGRLRPNSETLLDR